MRLPASVFFLYTNCFVLDMFMGEEVPMPWAESDPFLGPVCRSLCCRGCGRLPPNMDELYTTTGGRCPECVATRLMSQQQRRLVTAVSKSGVRGVKVTPTGRYRR
jgi:hypothetical protein